ncbi:MAG: hypothetical protein KF708_11645 [Pirellulales bacterium]|nr:hypothetical protein [Pirellulales bacterium]
MPTSGEPSARRPSPDEALAKVRSLLSQDQPGLAYLLYQRLQRELPEWQLPAPELVQIVCGLAARHEVEQAIPVMLEYLRRFPTGAPRMRLMLAQLLVRDADRPGQALAVMAKITPGTMPDELLETRKKLELEAHLKLASNPIEPAIEDW